MKQCVKEFARKLRDSSGRKYVNIVLMYGIL